MSGKKGRSGRKTSSEERKFQDLIKMTFEYLVMNFHKFNEKTKVNIALEIQKKAMTQKVEHSGEANKIINVINYEDTKRNNNTSSRISAHKMGSGDSEESKQI